MSRSADLATIHAINRKFYTAFESLEIRQMDEVWKHGDDVVCIHPGWATLQGWQDVRASWMQIFQHAEFMRFMITDEAATMGERHAIMVCTEHISSGHNGQAMEGTVYATNIFEKMGGRWLMIHHHGSPGPRRMPLQGSLN